MLTRALLLFFVLPSLQECCITTAGLAKEIALLQYVKELRTGINRDSETGLTTMAVIRNGVEPF